MMVFKINGQVENELSTYEFGFGFRDLPYDGIFLIVTSCQYLVAFEAKAGASDLRAAAH